MRHRPLIRHLEKIQLRSCSNLCSGAGLRIWRLSSRLRELLGSRGSLFRYCTGFFSSTFFGATFGAADFGATGFTEAGLVAAALGAAFLAFTAFLGVGLVFFEAVFFAFDRTGFLFFATGFDVLDFFVALAGVFLFLAIVESSV
jgi:hypothetical protein